MCLGSLHNSQNTLDTVSLTVSSYSEHHITQCVQYVTSHLDRNIITFFNVYNTNIIHLQRLFNIIRDCSIIMPVLCLPFILLKCL